MRELVKRSLVALIFGPVVLAGIYLGGWFTFALVVIISILMVRETRAFSSVHLRTGEQIVLLLLCILWQLAITVDYPHLLNLFISSVIVIFLMELLNHQISGTLERTSVMLFVFIYCGILLSSFIGVRKYGALWGLLPVIMVWVVDTFAYWGGTLLGHHKLAEDYSPKKSIEGFFCGFLSGVVMALGIIYFRPQTDRILLWSLVFITGIAGQIGDLFESKLKRQFGVKDMSNLMPGHGGMWDRTDSLLWVYPLFWVVLKLFG